MSVQIYKDGKLTPVAGELYESGNVVPLANHANTANTANKADSANRALTDGRGYEISRTYMPRGIDFKAGPFVFIDGSDRKEHTYTVTEDCFALILIGGMNSRNLLTIDGERLFDSTPSDFNSFLVPIPMLKGQTILFKSVYEVTAAAVPPGIKLYRYVY